VPACGRVRAFVLFCFVFCFLDFSHHLDWYLMVSHYILIYNSLMTYGVSYVYLPSLSSLVRCLFLFFAHFQLFAFLLLNFKSSLYILHTCPLGNMRFAEISFSSCLFVCLFVYMLLGFELRASHLLSRYSTIFFFSVAYLSFSQQ
jgi:hypothetical protein